MSKMSRRPRLQFSAWVGCTVVVAMATLAAAAGRHDGSHLHDLTMEVVTPHLEWATSLQGGPVKALFIVPRNLAAREVVELAQRMELDFEAVVTGHHAALGIDDGYNAAVQGTTTYEKNAEVLAKLDAEYQVIVLANFHLESLPAEAQYKILKKVSDGAGLMIAYPRKTRYGKLLENKTEDWKRITDGVSMAGLAEELQDKSPESLVATYRFGRGRIATLSYGSTPPTNYGGPGLTAVKGYSPRWQGHYENNMVLVARTLLWTADRDLPGQISLGVYRSDSGLPLRITGMPAGTTLSVRLRDAENQVLLDKQLPVTATAMLDVPQLPAGVYYLDWQARADSRTRAFGYQSFTVASPFQALSLEPSQPSYEAGEAIDITLKLAVPARRSLRMVTHLEDSPYGRIWARQEAQLPANREALDIRLDAPALPTIAGRVVCTILDGQQVLDRTACEVFVPQRGREVFPTMLWNSLPDYLARPVSARLVDDLGWRAGLAHPVRDGDNARLAALLNMRFVPYLTRVGIQETDGITRFSHFMGVPAKEVEDAGNKTDGSFYNPAIQKLWKKAVAARIVNLPHYGPMVYNLGDENFFSYDAGYAPSDEKAYRAYLQQRYGTIENLNREWQTDYGDFAAVEHERPAALRDKGHFAAWFDHRRFMEKQYADVHHFLAEQIKAIDPHALVGAEGSMPGDLELTISKLDFWGPYSNPVHDELLRSIGGDRLRMLWWGGYVGSHGGRDVYPYPLWRPLLQGVVNGNSWYTASISAEGFLGADLRHADYFKQMLPHLRDLDQGQAQLLVTQPLKQDGIAILWSHASHTASLMDERFFKPADSINAFMQFCYRKGLNFDFVTSSMVEQGRLADYKVLLLCGASALSGAEQAQIETFANNGGVVIADLKPGVLNGYCRPLETSSLGDLFGVPSLAWDSKLEMKPVEIAASLRGQPIALRAERAWQSPGIAPFTHRTVGNGLAVLLNFNLGSAVNTAATQTPVDQFLADLLAVAGVRPGIAIEGIEGEQLLVRLREVADGQTLGLVAPKSQIGKSLNINLEKAAFAYEVGGEALGKVQRIEATLDSPFKLYCLFDSEPAAPQVKLDRSTIALGQAAILDLSAMPEGGVYRLQVLDPDGNPLPRSLRVLTDRDRHPAPPIQVRRGLAPTPTAPVEVRFAFNDTPGRYTVELTDVRTGKSAESALEVTE